MSSNPFADPYQPPQYAPPPAAYLVPGQKPAVWTWYVIYCVVMALLYLVLVVLGAALLFGGKHLAENEGDEVGFMIMGFVYLALGSVLFLLYAAAPLLPHNKFAWIYGFVTIGLGLTSCCTLPFSIALLIYWLKPDLKAYLNAL